MLRWEKLSRVDIAITLTIGMSDKAWREIRFEGAGVSPGTARGKIHVVRDDLDDVPRYRIAPSQITDEIGRFEAALIQTRMQILEMQQRIAESIGAKDAAIFDAHLLVVEYRTLIERCVRKLETDLCMSNDFSGSVHSAPNIDTIYDPICARLTLEFRT